MREVEEAMDEAPPSDPDQRDGYIRIILDDLCRRVGPDVCLDYVLLPGLLPPEVWEHVVAEAERESRRRVNVSSVSCAASSRRLPQPT